MIIVMTWVVAGIVAAPAVQAGCHLLIMTVLVVGYVKPSHYV